MSHLKPIRVIGIGSPFGDDQLGWQAVTAVAQVLPETWPVDCLQCDTPAGNLLTLLAGATLVVLLDAVCSGNAPVGTIGCWRARDMMQLPATTLSSHGMDMITLLQLADVLGKSPQTWVFYGVEIIPTKTQLQAHLSAPVANAISQLVEQVKTEIASFLDSERAVLMKLG